MTPGDNLATKTQNHDAQTVVFRLSDESFGVDIVSVNEIIRPREITPVYSTEPNVLGVVSLRGQTIPVIDMCGRLSLDSATESTSSRIIVVETGQGNVGMMVDAVTEVVTIRAEDMEESPRYADNSRFYRAVATRDSKPITLLNVDQALAA